MLIAMQHLENLAVVRQEVSDEILILRMQIFALELSTVERKAEIERRIQLLESLEVECSQ